MPRKNRYKLAFEQRRLLLVLAASTGVSLALLLIRFMAAGNYDFWFLTWNLFLGWIPLAFAWWLVRRLTKTPWLTWQNLLLSVLWLGFLPNAFYIVSDFIHLKPTGDVSMLYDTVMLTSYTFNGFILGFISVYMVHEQLRLRLKKSQANAIIALVFLLCSFAIYLGRYLRWNSWDVIVNPFGLLFDISEPFINPGSHPQAFTTTLMFFVLLSSIYVVSFELVRILRSGALKSDS